MALLETADPNGTYYVGNRNKRGENCIPWECELPKYIYIYEVHIQRNPWKARPKIVQGNNINLLPVPNIRDSKRNSHNKG